MNKYAAILIIFLAAFTCTAPCAAQSTPTRVLVLPFQMNAPQDASYLQQGILDMLASRLEWGDKVEIVPVEAARQAFLEAGRRVDKPKALEIAGKMDADYVVFGSYTLLGRKVSLDAAIADVSGRETPLRLSTQTDSLDGVIPKVNEFAEDINAEIFGRPRESEAAEPSEQQKPPQKEVPAHRRHPNYLLGGVEGQNLSPLNPNFIAAVGSDNREGAFWRSPSFRDAVVGVDVGDATGDGANELVIATERSVTVSRITEGVYQQLGRFEVGAGDRLVSLDLADLNGDGVMEIFVSNQRGLRAHSLVLGFGGDRIEVLADGLPYYFRLVYLPDGPELMGQESGTSDLFYGKPRGVVYDKGRYALGGVRETGRGINVYNFARLPLSGSEKIHTVALKEEGEMVVRSASGETLWQSRENFAQTQAYLEKPYNILSEAEGVREWDEHERYYVPARLLAADLDGNGAPELIVSRNERAYTTMLKRVREFKEGAVHSLSYSQLAMRQNWRSKKLPGAVVDYQIKDYNNDGRKDLVVAVLLEYGQGLMARRSTIAAYELASPEEMREALESQIE